MGVATNFANQSGAVPASDLDDAFALAATQEDMTEAEDAIDALPGNATPLAPTAGGSVGVAAALSHEDHRHPPQPATTNLQTGTTYTIQSTDDGKVVELSNIASIAVEVPATLPVGFSCLISQVSSGQVTIAAGAGATQRQASSYTKTRAQWSEVTLRVRANSGGSAAEYVLAGDMAA